ncbi:GntR family transcriptional regulator [Muricomes sp. OA1]|nr:MULTISPECIES: GntR family transcriptional regulator [Clostridia]MCH1971296.1 GntR family transcriptional regulator [Muricomes sp. OA1]MEE0199914.1 GntR family transcriptional regulator [Muricomes sp.]GKH34594.1 GntR family transcriptional regulator [Faecalicatena contorta]
MAKKQSMTERVLNELRNDIINWNYNENDMITEAEISQKFGVSKTPSREALNYLCMEGFLEKIPNKGYLVKGISVMELQSLFQYRGILEKACAEMAIQYATADELRFLQELTEEHVKKAEGSTYQEYSEMNMDFHMSVAYLSRNRYLVSALENVLNNLRRVFVREWKSSGAKALLEAHMELVEVLIKRDVEQAKQYVARELEGAEYRIYFRDTRGY